LEKLLKFSEQIKFIIVLKIILLAKLSNVSSSKVPGLRVNNSFLNCHSFESDENWKHYWENFLIPDDISFEKKNELMKKYQYKYYSSNIETLPDPIPPCPLSLIEINPKETHTATLIFLHGLGVKKKLFKLLGQWKRMGK
jgi:hypothetical protein